MNTLSLVSTAPEHDLLFDDHAVLEEALGKDALKVYSVNTNCDCISVSNTSTTDDEDTRTPQSTPAARQAD